MPYDASIMCQDASISISILIMIVINILIMITCLHNHPKKCVQNFDVLRQTNVIKPY